VRLSVRTVGILAGSCLVLLAAPLLLAPPVAAQNPQTLLPAESAAKAKDLIQKAIQALGGPAYLGVRDQSCSGRLAGFDRSGELGGYTRFWLFTKQPDKQRVEYYKQRNLITVHNGADGWELDRGGVQDMPAERTDNYRQDLLVDLDYVLRFRLNEEGLIFRYGGADLVDLKQVDWVEIVDRERRTIRIAIDRKTSLPLRARVIKRDPKTRERVEELAYFSNYQNVQGVMTPLSIAQERSERKIFQAFYDECTYNTGLADTLFTREALEARFGELNKGKKKK
jgi:outer membrane lipoprotein-sorting protein